MASFWTDIKAQFNSNNIKSQIKIFCQSNNTKLTDRHNLVHLYISDQIEYFIFCNTKFKIELMIIYKQSWVDFYKSTNGSEFLSNNVPDVSNVFINVEELIGMIDYVSDSVNSQNDCTFFLTF